MASQNKYRIRKEIFDYFHLPHRACPARHDDARPDNAQSLRDRQHMPCVFFLVYLLSGIILFLKL
jgi:hypothetical protein